MRASRRMRALRAASLALALVLVPASSALAQVSVDPTVTPALNTGGWVRGMAFLLGIIGIVVLLLVVVAFMRYAPRFSTDETSLRVVRADRVRPGEELPRRTVDMKAAVPVVVAPPSLPEPAGATAAAPAAAPASAAPAAAPAAPAAPAQETAPEPAPAQAGPGAEAPSTEAPQAAPGSEGAPAEADAATEARETPAPAVSQPAPMPAETAAHADVSMDQEVFEQKLQELLAQGTDKRVAEGQARRAAMLAARKKAAGG
jgi:pyruvate dehydrogenase E2 component (dihydrolipoyllysine-residue acetyltransferase)